MDSVTKKLKWLETLETRALGSNSIAYLSKVDLLEIIDLARRALQAEVEHNELELRKADYDLNT